MPSESESRDFDRLDARGSAFPAHIAALGSAPPLRLRTRLLLHLGGVIMAMTLVLPFWGDHLERTIYDTFFTMRGPLSTPPGIVLVGIDDDSFQSLDLQWPWPRRVHGRLLASLTAARARVVVFDVLFDTHARDTEDDRLFAEAIAAHPTVILATARTIAEQETYTKASWLNPASTLTPSAALVGCIELLVDPDGVVRSARLDFGGVPSLGYLAANSFTGKDVRPPGADRDQRLLINYLGPPGTITTVSYYQALEPTRFLTSNTFKDKLVFVGSTAGLSSDPNRPDHYPTPYSQAGRRMPGIEIHANVAYNLLHGSHIRQAPLFLARAGGLLLGLLTGLLFYRFTPVWSGVLFAAMAGMVLLFAFGLFASVRYYLPPAWFLVAAVIAFLVSVFIRYYETYQIAKRNRLLLQRSEERIRKILSAQQAGLAGGTHARTRPEARTIKIFVSYRRKAEDARYMAEILEFLSGLRAEKIEFWTDQELRLGDRWDTKIKQNLAESDIALVLVSQAYLDSVYCIKTEINSFLERNVTIMPIMLSPCEWQRHGWLRERQFLPSSGETLAEHYQDAGKRQRMFLEIRAELRSYVDRLRAGDS